MVKIEVGGRAYKQMFVCLFFALIQTTVHYTFELKWITILYAMYKKIAIYLILDKEFVM